MSILAVNTIQQESGQGFVYCFNPSTLYSPGSVVQVIHSTVMERFYLNVPNNDGGMRNDFSGLGQPWGGCIIRPLDIAIKPHSIKSAIHIEFNMFYEAHQDIVFTVLRDDALIGASYSGWGTTLDAPNSAGRWIGAGVSRYDNNNDSTPSYIQLNWIDSPGSTDWHNYSIAAKSAGSSNFTMTVNTTISAYQNGQDAYETGVSFSIAQEIARASF